MVKTGTFARYMAMAADARLEWVPTSEAVKPRVSLPMRVTAARMSTRSSVFLIRVILFRTSAVFTVQVGCAPVELRCGALSRPTGEMGRRLGREKCDGDCISKVQVGVRVREFLTVAEKGDVSELHSSGAPIGRLA
eukprot:7020275-Ditylum_brightwellii.AAC.1